MADHEDLYEKRQPHTQADPQHKPFAGDRRPEASAYGRLGHHAHRRRRECAQSPLPSALAATSIEHAYGAQGMGPHHSFLHAGSDDLSLDFSQQSVHINGPSPQLSRTTFPHSNSTASSSSVPPYDLTSSASSQAYLDPLGPPPSFVTFERNPFPLSLVSSGGFDMSRQMHGHTVTSALADQYGPPALRRSSQARSSDNLSSNLTTPDPARLSLGSIPSSSPGTRPVMHAPPVACNADTAGEKQQQQQQPPQQGRPVYLKFPGFEHLHGIFLEPTCNSSSRKLEPNIEAIVDKNIFYHDVATCYRRNYISVQTSYTLPGCPPHASLYCYVPRVSSPRAIQAFGVSLSAAIDKPQGKSVALVQHTPKRDRGPKSDPGIVLLPPHNGECGNMHGLGTSVDGSGPELPMQGLQGQRSLFSTSKHSFERIQFQQATANNGRRRAQQQYYYLIVELHADCRLPGEEVPFWVKVSRRFSEPVVVRGRSPGHYKDNSKDMSSTDPGPGPSGGYGGMGPYESYKRPRHDSSSGNMGMSFHGHHHGGGGSGGGDSGGASYHGGRHSNSYSAHASPASFGSLPSPALSHSMPSSYEGSSRYLDDGMLLKQESDYSQYQAQLQYTHGTGASHDAYAGGRSFRRSHALDPPGHNPGTTSSINGAVPGWHSASLDRYAAPNPGFALDASCGY